MAGRCLPNFPPQSTTEANIIGFYYYSTHIPTHKSGGFERAYIYLNGYWKMVFSISPEPQMYITPPEQRQSTPAPQHAPKVKKPTPWLLYVVIAVSGIIWFQRHIASDPEIQNINNNLAGYSLCLNKAQANLHDAASAEFSPLANSVVLDMKDGSHLLTIPFRAKNGFGAYRKSGVHCIIESYGSDHPNLKSIQFDK